jgi:hypothetical protein
VGYGLCLSCRPVNNRESVGKSIQVNTKQKAVSGLWVVSVMSCRQQTECWQVNSGKYLTKGCECAMGCVCHVL